VRHVIVVIAVLFAVAAPAARAAGQDVTAPGLTATIHTDPWSLTFTDDSGRTVLQETGAGLGRLGYSRAGTWFHATRATTVAELNGRLTATLATSDPLGGTIALTVQPAGDHHIRVTAEAPSGVEATGIAFAAAPSEGFYGFGERSNAVDQRGQEVTNRVEDGPYPPQDNIYVSSSNPPWGEGERRDSTYYPVPWFLSSSGYGFLINGDNTSRFHLGDQDPGAWSADIDGNVLGFDVYGGPTPFDALRRFTSDTGRQPQSTAPWVFGPWFQTGQPNTIPLDEEAAIIKKLRDADAPVSAAETQLHFLPCGAQQGLDDYLAKRTTQFHDAGLAHLGYFNPSLCSSYQPVYGEASSQGLLQKGPDGNPITYPSFVGGSGPLGFTQEPIAQFDFSNPATEPFYARLIKDAYDRGYDGWMEDFGEYTAPDAVSHDGTPAEAMHNRYPTDYHCTVRRIEQTLKRPLTRHQRSGWTGSAKCADIVWGGDPTTIWGFDGLSSTIVQGMGIGMSGVGRWGSDIGGYTSFGSGTTQPGVEEETLTPEMLKRWIEVGAASPVMRTKRTGIAVPSYTRPQVFDNDIIGTWRRYTKLHTQLYPYLLAADAEYRRTGMPIMRHALLTNPDDPRALKEDGQYMFGDALLVAPVVAPGQNKKDVYAPAGAWLDFSQAVRYLTGSGGFVPKGRGRVLIGRHGYTLAAPLETLPMLIKAGSTLPLLPADVDTLASYGGKDIVHLSDRRNAMTLLAFPRGRATSKFDDTGAVVSIEGHRRWTLRIRSDRRRTITVRATLRSLRSPFVPTTVRLSGRELPFRYRDGVLTVKAKTRAGTLRVSG
jgi:alpha-glucosidase (family GH31 glycosyl hydrolase)